MIEFIRKFLREHLVLSVLIIVLAPFTTLSVFSLFFASDREVVYDAHMVSSHCGLSNIPGKDCAGIYNVIIGNTGTQEEIVQISWPLDLIHWQTDKKIMNIAADDPRTHDPVFTCDMTETYSKCVINKFAPGALMIIKLVCYACSSRDLDRLENTPVEIQTVAVLSYGDPRVTAVMRRIQILLNFIL